MEQEAAQLASLPEGQAAPDAAPSHHPPDFASVDFPPILEETLSSAWDLGVAAQYTVLTHFRDMLKRRKGVWENEDVEDVHQIRVAARRCRTALQTFASLWQDKQAGKFADYLAQFATAFNAARDLDVMLIWLKEQLEQSDADHASGYRWLYDRNFEKRQAEQSRLEKALTRLEKDNLPAAFVAYFAHLPIDLWELPPASVSAEPEAADG
jgi:inorganic triphosphatase YgiF